MTTIIHHSSDYDGVFCREVAKRFLPGAKLLGWDFGQPKILLPEEGDIYILDLPPECILEYAFLVSSAEEGANLPVAFQNGAFERLTWIDHHKSSIEKWPSGIKGYRIDGVAACRLAWQFFFGSTTATKEDFMSRSLPEPYALTLAGEYDVWQHSNSKGGDITFQFGLDTEAKLDFEMLLGAPNPARAYCGKLLEAGKGAQECYRKRDADIIRQRGFDLTFEGLNFIALNTARCNSQSFQAAVKPEHDGCLAFYWNGRTFIVSLYGVPGKPDMDLSLIAVKYGGGGHKQACGFQALTLPFVASSVPSP